ncbi:ATP-binding protein [Bacillus sp. 03113]|uniref:ATP-binding protein n=1 Tax=Bacillus sp. 03113 TaxID=2578211 RepID=UPI001144644A|nr:ATP-binding protein [Bacillus sp. 03113]
MIFIGGIHGVGKSFLCKKISEELKLEHHSSSQLISSKKNENFNSNKKIKDVDSNQSFLISALKELDLTNKLFLLDGHFCLLDMDQKISKIPEDTFTTLAPKGIVVLTDKIELIAERLLKRDQKHYTYEFLEKFQKTEVDYANYIAMKLQLPFYNYCLSSSTGNIFKFIENIKI